MSTAPKTTGVIICDHGSRRAQSNESLEEVARLFADRFAADCGVVEPAHMELAMPDIAAAYEACVKRGANHIVVLPFFLARGKHFMRDIPSLTSQAAVDFPGTTYQIAEPLGIDDLILDLLKKRLDANDQPILASGEADPRLKDTPATDKRIQCNTCPFELNKETGLVTIKAGSGVVAGGVRH
ncbi:MAG: CbiX/SirB N-terminal domain-containing protein [Planctomycetota bacterium]